MAQAPITTPTGEIVPAATQAANLRDLLEDPANRAALQKVLPKLITVDRYLGLVFNAMRKTPKLAECSPASLISAIRNAAAMGLEIDVNGEAYLVPFGNSRQGQPDVQLIPGYRGLIKMAFNSGRVDSIKGDVVYEKDDFDYYESATGPVFKHKHTYQTDKIIGAWVRIIIKGSAEPYIQFMPRHGKDSIESIRGRSAASGNGPWVTDEAAMCLKTVARRALKFAPTSSTLQGIITAEEEGEIRGMPADYTPVLSDGGAAVQTPEAEPEGDALICPLHDEPFFKRGKMKFHAHTYKDDEDKETWCSYKATLFNDRALELAGVGGRDLMNEVSQAAYSKSFSTLSIGELPTVLDTLEGLSKEPPEVDVKREDSAGRSEPTTAPDEESGPPVYGANDAGQARFE